MPAAAVTLAQGANRGCGVGLGRSTVAGADAAVSQGGSRLGWGRGMK